MSNQLTVKDFFVRKDVTEKFQELLGENSKVFITSVMQAVSTNNLLANAEPKSVYQSAMMAAVLNLPINNNIGHAYIVPYNQSVNVGGQWIQKQVAQFQIGYKGLIQLAIRSGQYKTISATEIYESQFKSYNPLTSEINFDFSNLPTGKIVGYSAYFKLNNGFEKLLFMTVAQLEEHGKKYSKSYDKANSVWKQNFNEMAKKTVLKSIFKYGPMTIDIQKAVESDQAIIEDAENMSMRYPDNTNEAPQTVIQVNSQVVEDAVSTDFED
jgi:recombination protein RecT